MANRQFTGLNSEDEFINVKRKKVLWVCGFFFIHEWLVYKKVFLKQEFKNLRRPWIKYLRTSKSIETNRKKNPTILIARRCFSITASCKNYTCTRSLNLTNAQFCVVNKIHAKVLPVAVSFQQSRPEHLLAPNHIVIHTWRCVCSCFYARLRICLQMVATSRKRGQAVNNTATHTLFCA